MTTCGLDNHSIIFLQIVTGYHILEQESAIQAIHTYSVGYHEMRHDVCEARQMSPISGQ